MYNGTVLRHHRLAKPGLAEAAIYTLSYSSSVGRAFTVVPVKQDVSGRTAEPDPSLQNDI